MNNPNAEIIGTPIRYELDGVTDDLQTAGLGADGLRASPPGFADPLRPSPRELRRRAIYMNYRGLTDMTGGGGFGSLFGPPGGTRVAGIEYLFAMRTPDGTAATTGMLQIPHGFDPRNPVAVAVASSGSRGIYGALPTAAEWGLRHGWAVIHSDKGTGTGIFDPGRGCGIRIDGTLTGTDDPLVTFAPSGPSLERLKADRPFSLLFKHANSGLNVEARWGEYLLQAIDAAFQLLNCEYPHLRRHLTPERSLIIASGISNGGAAVLRAVERDNSGWIDAAVVLEPNAAVSGFTEGLVVKSGEHRHERFGASLYDYATQHLLLQPCALLAEAERSIQVRNAIEGRREGLEQWCRDLAEAGALAGASPMALAHDARHRLLDGAILPQALQIGHLNIIASLWPAITVSYASAYARLAPDELPCGVSFAATDAGGIPRALAEDELARAFSDGTGIAPTAGIHLIAPDPTHRPRSVDNADAMLAIGLRSMHTRWTGTGRDAEPSATGETPAIGRRISIGEQQIAMTAHLHNCPVVILHGRADALIPVNHTSRAYYAVNQSRERADSNLRYYEVEHGQHFDAFLALPDLAQRYVPLQPHLLGAMDLVAARLGSSAPLPPSQVVRSRPRGSQAGTVPPLSRENLGDVRDRPGADAIVFDGHTLHVPD
ncbi:MAG: 3-hydroxybutyrate oligomer hydrolase family protein [Steroidobacteraceae bacterium]